MGSNTRKTKITDLPFDSCHMKGRKKKNNIQYFFNPSSFILFSFCFLISFLTMTTDNMDSEQYLSSSPNSVRNLPSFFEQQKDGAKSHESYLSPPTHTRDDGSIKNCQTEKKINDVIKIRSMDEFIKQVPGAVMARKIGQIPPGHRDDPVCQLFRYVQKKWMRGGDGEKPTG